MTGYVLGCLAKILSDELHRIATVGAEEAVAACGLRGGAVDDSYEIICDDDSVLAFLVGILRNDDLFDDVHCGMVVLGRVVG